MADTGVELLSREGFFRAYSAPKRFRLQPRHLVIAGVVLLVSALGYWVVTFEQEATPFRVDTYRGLRTVRRGMSPQEVSGVLGQPIGKERRGHLECFQYGRPSLKVPSYTLHTVCYDEGRLHEVVQRRYNSWVVTRDGAITPAPLAPEELIPPADPEGPGLAGQPPP